MGVAGDGQGREAVDRRQAERRQPDDRRTASGDDRGRLGARLLHRLPQPSSRFSGGVLGADRLAKGRRPLHPEAVPSARPATTSTTRRRAIPRRASSRGRRSRRFPTTGPARSADSTRPTSRLSRNKRKTSACKRGGFFVPGSRERIRRRTFRFSVRPAVPDAARGS